MKSSNVYIICIVLLAFFTQSCSKMNDLHQKYLDKGEIIYAAKVDSVAPGAGKGRIQFEMFIRAQGIETVRIFWNDYADSVEVQVANKTGAIKKMIENIAEKNYIFEFVSLDKYGHKSLPFEVPGNVYGSRYQSTLSNRGIRRMTNLENELLTIDWSGAVDNGVRSDLYYTNVAGAQVTRKVPMSETTTELTDMATDLDSLKYRTLFLPEVTAIDTFYTDNLSVPIPPPYPMTSFVGKWNVVETGMEPRISTATLVRGTRADEIIVKANPSGQAAFFGAAWIRWGNESFQQEIAPGGDITLKINPASGVVAIPFTYWGHTGNNHYWYFGSGGTWSDNPKKITITWFNMAYTSAVVANKTNKIVLTKI